jgi:putative transposase
MYPIATMCRVLGVSASGYYAWSARAPSARATSDGVLIERIGAIHAASRGTYGSPRIHAELAANGSAAGRKRVARLMKGAGLRGVCRRRFVTTTVRDGAPQAPDLVDRNFVATAPNMLWVADITYVPTWSGFLYLAVVLDVFSRRVVGWSMSTTLQTELVLAALNMALAVRKPRGVIHHSDQGSQYTSLAFGRRCREMGVRPSMGSVGDAYDNAMAESFFATLECELLARHRFKTQADARTAIFQFVEGFYNPRRRHSALGYLSPAEFERRHARAMASSPGAPKSAGVLATVKDKPLRARPKRRVLDGRCARRPAQCVGRDEGTGSCGAEQRNSTTREDKTSSLHRS